MSIRDRQPFTPKLQADLFALLLHRPGLYRDYAECWKCEFFDHPEVRAALHHWIVINATGQVPSRAALEHSITRNNICGDRRVEPAAVLDYLDKLFNHFPDNDKFLLQELEQHARDENVFRAMSQAINELEEGRYESAASRLIRAVATGSRAIKLAPPEWYDSEPVLKRELISGILRRGHIGIFNGHSKSYKSWTLLNCGMAVAMGRSWLGFRALVPARVLYINMELDPEEFKIRVDKLAGGMGLSREALKGKMDFLNLKGHDCSLENLAATLRLLRDPASPWELVFIDPTYKLLMAGLELDERNNADNIENNNAAVGSMFCKLEGLAAELDLAIFLVHHFKKGNSAETANVDSGSGAGVFGRAPDAIFSLHPVRDEDNEIVEDAYVVKTTLRYFPAVPDFGVRLDPHHLIFNRDITVNPDNLAGKTGRPQKYHIGQALSILQSGRSYTFKQWKDHAREECGMNDRNLGIFRDQALEQSFVTASGPTEAHKTTYTLTPLGEEAILQANVAAAHNGHLSKKAREVYSRIRGNGEAVN
jgi:hypothetical protein